MPYVITISKKTSAEKCSLEIQELYFQALTNEIVAISKLTGSDNVEDAKATFICQAVATIDYPEGLVKSVKNVFVKDDKDVKIESDKYKNQRCIYSKIRNVEKDNDITIRNIYDFPSTPLDNKTAQLPDISIRDMTRFRAVKYSLTKPADTTAINENETNITPSFSFK